MTISKEKRLQLLEKIVECSELYVNICIEMNEVPKKEITMMIFHCESRYALHQTIKIFNKRIQEYRELTK